MSNLITLPLEDGFKTSLSQTWTGGVGTVNVVSTPSFTFPAGVTTYIVVNPGKTNMQIAEINAYDASAKTMTVSNITLEKGASVNSTAQTHNVGSEVIISDNYQFWSDIQTAINSKLDNDADWTWGAATDFAGMIAKPLTTAQRDALTGVNGMIINNSTTGVLNQYIGGAWTTFATGSVSNASETVAGKVELPTDAEVTAGTATGATTATLTPTNAQTIKSVSLKAVDSTLAETDHLVFDNAGTDNKMLVSVFRDQLAASTTAKGTVELATDAESVAGTDETRYVNSKQAVLRTDTITLTRDNTVATGTVQYSHGLTRVPKLITFHCIDSSNQWSNGAYDGTTNTVVYATGTPGSAVSSTICIRTISSSGSAYQEGVVSAMTTTTFDIDWTKVGSPTGTSAVQVTLIS